MGTVESSFYGSNRSETEFKVLKNPKSRFNLQIKCKIGLHYLIFVRDPTFALKNPFPRFDSIRDPKCLWITFEKLGPEILLDCVPRQNLVKYLKNNMDNFDFEDVFDVAPVTMFRTGLMSAEKAGTSGCRCSHIGCQMTRPLANRKVRSDSCRK
jgi:hypothetical protein